MTLHYNKDKTISFCKLHIKFHACVNKEYSKIKNYSENIHSHYFSLSSYTSFYLNFDRNWNTINTPLSMRRLCKLWVRQGQVFLLKHCWLHKVQFCFHKTLHLLSVSLVRLTLLPHKKQPKNLKKVHIPRACIYIIYVISPPIYIIFSLSQLVLWIA